jgi:ATP synthase protein I
MTALSSVSKILRYQFLVIIIVALFFEFIQGQHSAISAVLGGLAGFIPNFYFAIKLQKGQGTNARKILHNFYMGETIKLILTVSLFAIIFHLPNIILLPLFVGYCTVLSVFWFALLIR